MKKNTGSLSRVMETGDHFKNGASLKIRMSRGNFTYVATSTTATHVIDYPLAQVGTIDRFRWVNARNQPGPWSEIIFAVIP